MQWQETVKVLVKFFSDSFQAEDKLERFGYPSQFADFVSFSWKYCKCVNVKTIRSLLSVLLSFYLRSLGTSVSSIRHEIDFKTVKLTKEMPGNCVYEEYG